MLTDGSELWRILYPEGSPEPSINPVALTMLALEHRLAQGGIDAATVNELTAELHRNRRLAWQFDRIRPN
jgi:hypothetical protein